MKTLILVLLLASSLLADNMECETALNTFQFNIEQSYPITDELLITAIYTCEDIADYEGLINTMMLMLETTTEA